MDLIEALYGNGETSSRPLWLDHWQYTGPLLLRGLPIPWFQPTDFDGFFRKAHGLLEAEVVVFPISDLLQAHVQSAPELRGEMGSKKRTAFAARALLRDEALRSRVRQCVNLTTQAAPSKPLVLSMPSPQDLLAWAYESAHGNSPEEIDADLADSAAMYLSDFLSSLSDCAVAAVMAQENSQTESELTSFVPAYAPIRNACSHLRWQFGLRLAGGLRIPEEFDFAVSANPRGAQSDGPTGAWLPKEFWLEEGDFQQPQTGFLYGQIPADANPEFVLDRRKSLRAA